MSALSVYKAGVLPVGSRENMDGADGQATLLSLSPAVSSSNMPTVFFLMGTRPSCLSLATVDEPAEFFFYFSYRLLRKNRSARCQWLEVVVESIDG